MKGPCSRAGIQLGGTEINRWPLVLSFMILGKMDGLDEGFVEAPTSREIWGVHEERRPRPGNGLL